MGAAHLAVRADTHGADRLLCIETPLAESLAQEGYAGNEEEHLPVAIGHLLGDAKGSESLTRTTGHDKFAPVVVVVMFHSLINRFLLMTKHLLVLGDGLCAADTFVQFLPVDGHLGQFVEVQHGCRNGLPTETFSSMRGKTAVGGIYPKTETKKMLIAIIIFECTRRGGEESVNIPFVYLCIGTIAFALYGPIFIVVGLRHKVDT